MKHTGEDDGELRAQLSVVDQVASREPVSPQGADDHGSRRRIHACSIIWSVLGVALMICFMLE
jgi:hypothetical protein